MTKNYRFDCIIEISQGRVILRQDLIRSNFPKRTNHRMEILRSFHKHLLYEALNINVGIIDLNDINSATTLLTSHPEEKSVNEVLIKLIVQDCGEYQIAKNLPIPDEYGHVLRSSANFIRNEDYASFLAINHLLNNNNPSYVENLDGLNDLIENFYRIYIHSNKIKLLNHQLNKPISSFKNEISNPSIIQYIHECIQSNDDIHLFFLFNLSIYRDKDLYENHGLGELENNDYSSQTSSEYIRLEWIKNERIWDSSIMESLKLISKNYNRRIYLKATYDYPIKNGYNFHLI